MEAHTQSLPELFEKFKAERALLQCRNLSFFGFGAAFCLTVMRCTCVASGKVETLAGYHCRGAHVLCFMVINRSIKSPMPVS